MSKIIVEVFVPAADCRYDVLLSPDIRTDQASQLIAAAIEKQTGGMFLSSSDSVLCERNNGTILDINRSLADQEIENGSQLMLI